MLQHLSTRPPTTRPRSSPNPQPHSARYSFSFAVFTQVLTFTLFFVLSLSFSKILSMKITKKWHPFCSQNLWHVTPAWWKGKSYYLAFICGVPKRVHLVTWWHEWAPLLAAAGLCLQTPSSCMDCCQVPFYLLYLLQSHPPPAPHILLRPPAVSNSDWAPLCVMWARTDPASVSISKGPTVNIGYISRRMSCEIFSRSWPWG